MIQGWIKDRNKSIVHSMIQRVKCLDISIYTFCDRKIIRACSSTNKNKILIHRDANANILISAAKVCDILHGLPILCQSINKGVCFEYEIAIVSICECRSVSCRNLQVSGSHAVDKVITVIEFQSVEILIKIESSAIKERTPQKIRVYHQWIFFQFFFKSFEPHFILSR